MAKFIEEFKEFAFKGNVMDMAVGVIRDGHGCRCHHRRRIW